MSQKVFVVGRNPNVSHGEIAVKIDDPSKKVSSNHCRITYDGSNFFVEDLISVNGTFVNGSKISSKTPVTNNSSIKLGEKYVFSLMNSIIQSAINADENTNRKSEIRIDDGKQEFSFSDKSTGKSVSVSFNTENKFFSFIQPLLDYIDNGKFFKNPILWVYTVFAFFSLLFPFSLIIASRAFSKHLTGKDFFALILMWLIVAFASWIVFQILWNRRDELEYLIKENDEFKATPIIAHIIKTYGEVLGVSTAINGFGITIIGLLFYGEQRGILNSLVYEIPLLNLFTDLPLLNIILFPIIGYLLVVLFKFISEFVSVFTSIANNTKNKK